MPNWCSCDLMISGKKEQLKQFKEYAKSNSPDEDEPDNIRLLDANKFIPYPEEWKKLDEEACETRDKWSYLPKGVRKHVPYPQVKDGYNQGGYNWCIQNWGTKWNFCDVHIEYEKPKSMMYTFETAWSPPIPVIQAMSNKFGELRFTLNYYETGMGFQGIVIIKNGQILKDDHFDNYQGHRGG